jgi:hypothetical protein
MAKKEYAIPYKRHAPYFTKEKKDATGNTFKIPSVTQVLGTIGNPEGLINWAIRETIKLIDWDERKAGDYTVLRDWYADIGTTAHRHMELILQGNTPDLLTEGFDQKLIDAAQNSIGAFELWLERHEVEPLYIEEVLVSDTFELGGTADLIATVDGKVEVIDFKTGTKLKKHNLQVAAYFMLAQESGIHVDQCRMVYGHRNKKSDNNQLQEVVVYRDEIEELWNCIRAAKYLFERI